MKSLLFSVFINPPPKKKTPTTFYITLHSLVHHKAKMVSSKIVLPIIYFLAKMKKCQDFKCYSFQSKQACGQQTLSN